MIAFLGAFHGRTFGALSLTGSRITQRAHFAPLVPEVEHVPYGDVSYIKDQLFKRTVPPDEVAAIFVEAIQGEGGYIVPPPNFLPDLRALCDEHKIMLVLDEVQSGFGRTGKMFAIEHSKVEPDILCLAKGIASGLPLGAMVAKESVMTWPEGAHGSTFGGNPVSCRAALASLDLIQREYMANTVTVGRIVMEHLKQFQTAFNCVGEVRGKGLMLGMDIVTPGNKGAPDKALRDKLIDDCFYKGLLLLGCGEATIRFCPPLCITPGEALTGLDILARVIKAQGTLKVNP